MKRIIIVLTALFLASCTLPEGALTPTPGTTPTTEATDTTQPSATSTTEPTETPEPTGTVEPVLSAELFYNNGLDVNPYQTPQDGPAGTLRVADGWVLEWNPSPELHLCKEGQVAGVDDCNELKDIGGHKPEAKPIDFAAWVFPFAIDDPGQQWFCQGHICDVALGQAVVINQGSECIVSFTTLDYQQEQEHWYDKESIPRDPSGFNSDWYIYQTFGDLSPWEGGGVQLAHWEEWDTTTEHIATFTANGNDTLWIRNTRGYPVFHQESIVYDASLRCWETPEEPQPTPEVLDTPTPIAQPEETPNADACTIQPEQMREDNFRVLYDGQAVYSCPDKASDQVGSFIKGRLITSNERSLIQINESVAWYWVYAKGECAGVGPCAGWVPFVEADGTARLCREAYCESSAIGSHVERFTEGYPNAPTLYSNEDMGLALAAIQNEHNRSVVFANWRLGDDFYAAGGMWKDPSDLAAEAWRVADYFILHMRERGATDEQLQKICVSGFNEPVFATDSNGSAEEKAARYAAFEIERMRMADERGLKACVGKFSVGTPDYPILDEFGPMFQYAAEHGHPVLSHQYGGCIPALWYSENQNAAFVSDTVDVFDTRYATEAHLIGRHRSFSYDPLIIVDEFGADFVGTNDEVVAWCGGLARGWRTWVPLWRANWHDEARLFLAEQSHNPEFPAATQAFIANIASHETLSDEELYFAFILWADIQYRRDGVDAQIFVDGDFGNVWWEFQMVGVMHDLHYEYINTYYE